ncbi:MAG: polyprenyl diphosphate synthase [Chloroflexota bacterium]|nr:polyprenyl diphosphate synthase [Chloroflexota bacterium]
MTSNDETNGTQVMAGQLRIPHHVGIIMDGNGRWAQEQGLPRFMGHRAGTDNIRQVLEASVGFGIKVLTIYAFSTENWGRPPAEVRGLMRLLSRTIEEQLQELHENGVQIRHSGSLVGISEPLKKQITRALELTSNNDRIILNVAFNYGGRAEIIDGIRRVIEDGLAPEQITEDIFSHYLYTHDLPDADLIIRTGGEYRLSNFLIWQAAYAEYYATPTYWPDFDEAELRKALEAFSDRDRRFGHVQVT